jgi:hypothetical protein
MKTRRIVGTISLSEIVHKSGLRGEKATFPLLIEQLISSTRQRQTLARLSRDLHRKSVVPIVQSLTAVQNSKVQKFKVILRPVPTLPAVSNVPLLPAVPIIALPHARSLKIRSLLALFGELTILTLTSCLVIRYLQAQNENRRKVERSRGQA